MSIENNIILGNRIDLNFCDSNWNVFDTIILVWENGSWKSTILNIIHEFSNFGLPNGEWNMDEKRAFEVEFSEAEMEFILEQTPWLTTWNIFKISYDTSIKNWWDQLNIEYCNKYFQTEWEFHKSNYNKFNFVNSSKIRKNFKSIFSDVSINFNSNRVANVTNIDTDMEITENKKSTETISTEITQMLVDIRNKDNEDLVTWQEINKQYAPIELREKRTTRFKKAFKEMFWDKLEFVWVKALTPIFKKGDKEIQINNLSSWEKQIVFRGSYLLKDKESIKWGLILIDEPEISLHPKWQLEILNFYKNLFKNEQWIQESQIFTVTHSPFIIHSWERMNDKVIAFERDSRWSTVVSNDAKYFWYTDPIEFSKESFNISDFPSDKPVIFSEGKNYEFLNKAKEFFCPTLDIEVQKIDILSCSHLKTIFEWFHYSQLIKNKAYFIWDVDATSDYNWAKSKETNLLTPILLPKNTNNTQIPWGIENMFNDEFLPTDLKENYYKTKSNVKNDGWNPGTELNKRKLEEFLLKNASIESFSNFEQLFVKISDHLTKK